MKENETVWLENGQECIYLGSVGTGHVVAPQMVLEDHNEPRFVGKEIYVRKVFPSPPRYKFHEEIEKKQAILANLRKEIRDTREEHKKTESLKADIHSSLSEIEDLQHIKDFIDGKITHFLGTTWKTEIITFEEAMRSQDEYTHRLNPLKLLCLFGDSEGNLSWNINMYRDGSGSWRTWRPFTSYEDAKAALSERASKEFAKYLSGDRVAYLYDLIKECRKHNVVVPDEVQDKCELDRCQKIQKSIDEYESKLASLRRQLIDNKHGTD